MNENLLPPPSLDTWTSFFLLAAGQGILLSLALFFQKNGQRRANLLLGFYTLLFALSLVDYVGYWTRYNLYFPRLRGFYEYFVFLFGPLLLLYFKAVFNEPSRRKDWLHLAASPLYLALALSKWWEWFPSVRVFVDVQALIFILHLSIYGVMCFRFLKKKEHETEVEPVHRRWHRLLLWLYGGFVLGWVVYFVLIRTPFFSLFYDYSISLAMTVFIYLAGFLGYRRPEIFSGKAMAGIFQRDQYRHSSLTPAAADSLLQTLLRHMQKQEVYLDSELRLAGLAAQLGVSTHHLSQVINEKTGQGFSEFVNEYRFERAKQLFSSPASGGLRVSEVMYAAGFNNKTTFNKIFKEQTGLTPSEFKARHMAGNGVGKAEKAGL